VAGDDDSVVAGLSKGNQRRTLRQCSDATFVGLLMLTVIATWGCGNPSGQTTPSPSKSPEPSGEVNQASPQRESDQSLKTEEYVRLGLPAPHKVWSGADMIKANNLLASIARENSARLPSYQSPRSGAVFARLTSTESLPSFTNRDVPVQTRLGQALDYCDGLKEILKTYTAAFLSKEVTDAEVVELTGAFLRCLVVELDLVDEFVLTLDKSDPKYVIRMQGLETMKLGLAQIVSGLLVTLTERDRYRDSELVRLVAYMQETLPAVAQRMSPAARTETVARLQQMQEDPKMKHLQPGLRELLGKVQNVVEKRKVP
jgi:hypothetical protein